MSMAFGESGIANWCGLFGIVLALLGGCDAQKIAQLEPGVSTEADVRAQFGEPAAIYAEPGGERTFEYSRQPEGQTNYMITIGADGRMSALRQVLKPANLAKIQPGWDKSQVRRLLGKPGKTRSYALQQHEETWDWRYADGQESKIFSVTFDPDGRVTKTSSQLDPRDTEAK
jgi:outer membrane protein assembly factor BamE (lipoprotein component of BamABCDE complex)